MSPAVPEWASLIAIRGNNMDNNVAVYLNYLQVSLADASRLTPDLMGEERVEVAADVLLAGDVDQHSVKALSELARKRQAANRDSEDRAEPIPVLVCPRVYGLRPEHGRGSERLPARIAPIVLSAMLTRDGKLVDDDRIKAPVLVPRNLLEPTPWEIAIGTVDDADTVYAKLDTARGAWRSLVSQADTLLNGLTGQTLEELKIEGYACLDVGAIFLRGPGGDIGCRAAGGSLARSRCACHPFARCPTVQGSRPRTADGEPAACALGGTCRADGVPVRLGRFSARGLGPPSVRRSGKCPGRGWAARDGQDNIAAERNRDGVGQCRAARG